MVDIVKLSQEAAARAQRDLRVYVVGGGFEYIKMFHEAGFSGARSVEDCDIVCFTGGSDVSPHMYGEKAHPTTQSSAARDNTEADIWAAAFAQDKPMVGICRGAQFLNVMNGGKLWQDVDNHATARGHEITIVETGEIVTGMTSTHHQMMRPTDDAVIIATAALSTRKEAEKDKIERDEPENDDVEIVWYPDTFNLCFQPHPEFSVGNCREVFLRFVDDLLIPAT